jgi:hypothetical protein
MDWRVFLLLIHFVLIWQYALESSPFVDYSNIRLFVFDFPCCRGSNCTLPLVTMDTWNEYLRSKLCSQLWPHQNDTPAIELCDEQLVQSSTD